MIMRQKQSLLTEFNDNLALSDDFKHIVIEKIPLIDVRAPVEFEQGAFDSSINLPLMDDEERRQVGIEYKVRGNKAAVKLGHQLVNEIIREPRIHAWQQFIAEHPQAMLYCFRGGMRSKIAQQWLSDHGTDIVRLKGGYKAFRRFLIDYLDKLPGLIGEQGVRSVVIAGRTGSGKTQLLHKLDNQIDLEGLANHRGSAFGRHYSPQPSQIDFENNLSMAFMRLLEQQPNYLVVEDEGRNIGSVNLPKPLFDELKNDLRVVLDTPIEERIDITLQEYVIEAQQEYPDIESWQEFMHNAFSRIAKRLGGERQKRVLEQFDSAMKEQLSQGGVQAHQGWIATLLQEYYDPMYDYQMQKHQRKVSFVGTAEEVKAFLQTLA
ncbi:tRNA 2-selenouridine(34) synthase MnmH [Thiomicrorhabdus sediminis]|nr:tRNA 2-selenouridine(34) synthase MnmH [Thiomicrorhabdus sediminis]